MNQSSRLQAPATRHVFIDLDTEYSLTSTSSKTASHQKTAQKAPTAVGFEPLVIEDPDPDALIAYLLLAFY